MPRPRAGSCRERGRCWPGCRCATGWGRRSDYFNASVDPPEGTWPLRLVETAKESVAAMGFYEVLDRVVALLQERGRVTYRGLKREFQLDDASLEDLKDELIHARRVAVDEQATVLVWTGTPPRAEPVNGPPAEAERRLHTVLLAVTALLGRERRITYRTLRQVLGVDDACLHAVRDELRFRRLAREEDGQGLVWTGEDAPRTSDAVMALAVLPADDDVPHTPADVPVLTSREVHSG